MQTPASTYRLQITEDFDLLEAARTLAYLHELGVDWVYLSPVLAAESGSDHGYDVSDHSAIDPSRGRGAGLSALSSEARRLGMGVLVDIVPNHVGIARPWENAWWWHVLTHGRESPYADAFDIDWDAGGGRLLIPVVGDDDLRENGTIEHLRVLAGELHYHDQRFPLAPGTAAADAAADPDAVHARQHYELVHWRRGDSELNYRRFFSVSTLAAIRVEDPEWFTRSHEEVARWFADELVDGLRIDHPDGLRDPAGYLDDLAELTGGAYVLVEKILEPGERLPDSWATAGTTGYDALALVDRVLTDPAGEQPLGALEDRLRGAPVDWPAMIHGTKRTVADTTLLAETRRIARELAPWLDEAPAAGVLEDVVAELLACFPVYRSYLPEGRSHLDEAFAAARRHRPDLADVLDLVAPVLGDGAADATQRFQQTSGMVMAKGVEDCAFYRWARLTSLNEVGGDPSVFSVTPHDFHEAMAVRQAERPHAMTAASTHDTKRGEDVRARIAVLAEVPDLWAGALDRLLTLAPVPDAGFGNLLWQAVVGTWSDDPALRERLHAYAEKAMREAGDRTTWTAPDEAYEHAVHAAVDAAFDDERVRAVLDEVLLAVGDAGRSNALSAKLVGLTMPGVPDVYQGSELREDSLVDPDNRRPVDFDVRRRLVAEDRPGHPKLLLVRETLRLRRDRPELFTAYDAVPATGEAAGHALAFDRGGLVTVATRLPVGLAARGGWGDTTLALPAGRWRDALTGAVVTSDGSVPVADLLTELPVALLEALPEQPRERGRFEVWAPLPSRVRLAVGDEVVEMTRSQGDWWRPAGPVPEGEADYGYLLDDADTPVPDPRSLRQPGGVHGRSRTFDPGAFAWTDHAWHGRPLAGAVVYELHVGTFTPQGTLDAAIERLDHLAEIGVGFVELMPVNAFNGRHGWGYDGVLWSAVHEPYGGPEAYQRFVDACHARGLGVVQDVVHNHLGPSGNYLTMFGPYLVDGDTPWGDQVNLDREGSDEVRRLVLDSVRGWFTDFHVDGLRLDAVHALVDGSDTHLLEEMASETAALAAYVGKPLFLVAESDLNDPRVVAPREAGGLGLDAQWSDDFHHALHVALTGETDGYYADFEPLGALAKVLERGFFHDGTWSSFRGRDHGSPLDTERVPGWRLVVANQNHDQVGNRARGDRLTESLDDDQLAVAALLTLASPFTPMLFMGEEWGASTPFAFFTDHPEADLGQAVTEGRRREFERMAWGDDVPDPQDPATFEGSRLDWSELDSPRGRTLLGVYRELAALRRTMPVLTDPDLRTVRASVDEDERWLVVRRGKGVDAVVLGVSFSDRPVTVPLDHDVAYVVAFATPGSTQPVGSPVGGDRLILPPHVGVLLRPDLG
ncbi:malto-oligosyltrehalose synthase [Nocardioides euryhalodurans]|uniref:malto-oligosyltrehalose synthase n=1 Tax=Nocardioides euryhalodurans TaxID=2518370 RepID=UPI001FC93EDC|nr:malto-oligosyltrehalose synthase [Nocardioides euryhalodurans]